MYKVEYLPEAIDDMLQIEDYLLFYSVDEKRRLVVIHRMFHHSQNVRKRMLKR